MAKVIPDAIIDAMLDQLAADGDNVHVCDAEPASAAAAAGANQLATQAIATAQITKANGDVSGRKITVDPPNGTNVDNTGTATHLAVTNGANTILKWITTVTSQALTAGNTVDIPAFDHEIRDNA